MTNDRFNDDVNPHRDPDEPYRTDLGDEPSIDTDVFEVVRVPTSPVLARIRYHRDPVFASIVEMVVDEGEWKDAVQLLEESPGHRLKASKAHLGTAVDAVPLDTDAPIAAVVEDDPRVAWLNDWADDPVSGYSARQVPDTIERVVDALPRHAQNVARQGIQAYRAGEVTRRELESAFGELAKRYDVDPQTEAIDRFGGDTEAFTTTSDGKTGTFSDVSESVTWRPPTDRTGPRAHTLTGSSTPSKGVLILIAVALLFLFALTIWVF